MRDAQLKRNPVAAHLVLVALARDLSVESRTHAEHSGRDWHRSSAYMSKSASASS